MNGVGEIVFKALNGGEITRPDAELHLAIDLATRLHEYNPRVYPQLPVSLEHYAEGRAAERMEYEQDNSRRLGAFTHTVRELENRNYSDYDLICWAARILWARDNEELALKCATSAKRFKRFDRSILGRCYEAQRLDSIARSR